ncbi:MAG TPA: hypothetical protein VGD67_26440 [Pseudonocardiaceae bacterium]
MQSIVESGVVAAEQVDEAGWNERNAYVLLCAIDRAFATLDPYVGTRHQGELRRFRTTFRRLRRYNKDGTDGAVLPRRSFPARPQQIPDHEADHFHSLMLVPALPADVRFRYLHPEFDFPERTRAETDIAVGCVPFLASTDELDITRIEDAEPWYSIKARTTCRGDIARWQQRISQVLANLDDSGAHIGVLPELALTDELLDRWQKHLLATPRTPASNLEWVLVGTGPLTIDQDAEQSPNRAVLLHRDTGRTLMTQDKRSPFTMTDQQIHDWQLTALAPGPLTEWMHDSRDGHEVLETRIARLAILICEDVSRLLTVGAAVAGLAPTLLLVPVFAPPILRYRWQHTAAEQFAHNTGSATVVATSCAITLRPDPHRPPVAAGDSGTALVLMPHQPGPSDTWSIDVRLGDACGDPTRVVVLPVPRS